MSDQFNSTNIHARGIHVAVAVIRDLQGNVLVSRRLKNAHQGGLWEFPGGKKEQGETIFQALQRELKEELALTINSAQPLITITHDYDDRRVILDVWTVSSYSGEPVSCEGQKFKWVSQQALLSLEMPAADIPIVRAVNLPQVYAITPEPDWLVTACSQVDDVKIRNTAIKRFISEFKHTLQDVGLIQLRLKNIDSVAWVSIVEACVRISKNTRCKLVLNSSITRAIQLGTEGAHLDGKQLQILYKAGVSVSEIIKNSLSSQSSGPDAPDFIVSASCHDQLELEMAQELKIDFAVLSPVNFTKSHPAVTPMGWERFQLLSDKCKMPVYALGGLCENDISLAQGYGAQGVAGISAFWKDKK